MKKEEEDKKKEGNATGSVEKGEKTEGKIVDGKEVDRQLFSPCFLGKNGGIQLAIQLF